jgi:hypothetical protein
MKIKSKKVKDKSCLNNTLYTEKIGSFKFEADIFITNDGKINGELVGKIGSDPVLYKADATLDDWIDAAEGLYFFYGNLYDFLREVRHCSNVIVKRNEK